MANPEPGWYPYGGSGPLRWWDGQKWESDPSVRVPARESSASSFAGRRDRGLEINPSGWAVVGFVILMIFIAVIVGLATLGG